MDLSSRKRSCKNTNGNSTEKTKSKSTNNIFVMILYFHMTNNIIEKELKSSFYFSDSHVSYRMTGIDFYYTWLLNKKTN